VPNRARARMSSLLVTCLSHARAVGQRAKTAGLHRDRRLNLRSAPFMLSLGWIGDDPVVLQNAFNGVYFWGWLRGAAQMLAFCANVWSLALLTEGERISGAAAGRR
jgi:hypothetical protein